VPLIGSHATVTGGLAASGLSYAAAVGAEVIQVFVSNPRGWAAGPGDAGEDARLRESGIPVFIHSTYLINLGSGNPDVAAKSADAVAHALRRGGDIGARGVVVHTGSAAGWTGTDARERALRQIGEIVLPLLDKLGDDDPDRRPASASIPATCSPPATTSPRTAGWRPCSPSSALCQAAR
jgi:deoxyribonuclease-4